MKRSKWKGYFICASLMRSKSKSSIWNRSSCISNYFLEKKIKIHNGKDFKNLLITRDKIGFKFGEFSFTRKMYQRIKKKKNLKKK